MCMFYRRHYVFYELHEIKITRILLNCSHPEISRNFAYSFTVGLTGINLFNHHSQISNFGHFTFVV